MPSRDNNTANEIQVWDLPIRVFHWALAVLVILGWSTSEGRSAFQAHLFSGIGILMLIFFRLIWGVIGSRYARFTNFLRPWPVVRDYSKKMRSLCPPHFVGHNPLGGWMMVFIMIVLLLVVFSGLFSSDNGNVGPLAGKLGWLGHTLQGLHGGVAGFLGFVFGLHVSGVLSHWFLSGENLTRSMWTGAKSASLADADASAKPVKVWRLILALVASASFVWMLLS